MLPSTANWSVSYHEVLEVGKLKLTLVTAEQ
jgi:hypothetical protein